MTIHVAGMALGILMIAAASRVFWRIGRPGGLAERWKRLPGIESLIVLVVLGGWFGGASILIKSAMLMFSD